RRYPPVRLVVTTFRLPHRGPAARPPPPPPRPPPPPKPPNPPPPPVSQVAIEYPWRLRGPASGCVTLKWKSRVCVPASISTFKVLSSAQVMCSLPGTRRLPPAPYTRHGSDEV